MVVFYFSKQRGRAVRNDKTNCCCKCPSGSYQNFVLDLQNKFVGNPKVDGSNPSPAILYKRIGPKVCDISLRFSPTKFLKILMFRDSC